MSLYNFYAGPGKLPRTVLNRIESELKDFRTTGFSVMEISHRAEPIVQMIERTQAKFKRLLNLDDEDEVLFLQGGGTMQFAMVPMNLSNIGDKVDYVDTGYWSQKAIKVAQELDRDVAIAGKSETAIPQDLCIRSDAKFLHLCSNNTVMGTQWFQFPVTDVPIIADMSSDILSREIAMQDFGLVYAHAQKTIGAAGVTVVVIPKKTLSLIRPVMPSFFGYDAHINAKSNYHTPPVFAIYVVECMLDWLADEIGGVTAMEAINQQKSQLLYEFLDSSSLFQCPVSQSDRSIMNAIFDLYDPSHSADLLHQAQSAGIFGIEGHRSKGGFRASLYNAVTLNDVKYLVEFLTYFESRR